MLVKPFISALVGAIVVTYVLYPIYNWLYTKTRKPNLTATVMIIAILLIITVPFVLVSNLIITESTNLYEIIEQGNFGEEFFSTNSTCTEGLMCTGAMFINEKASDPFVVENFTEVAKNLISLLFQKGSTFLLSLPERVLFLFILLFTSFYLFKEGPKVVEFIKKLMPLGEKNKNRIMNKLQEVVYATIYGAVVIAIFQGSIAGIGYFLFGITNYATLAILTMMASLLPFVGTGLVWVPVSIYLAAQGILLSNNSLVWRGVGLFLFGALIVATIDNLIRPKVVGDRAKVNPVIILLGAFGGLRLFGFFGIFVGPVILVILLTLLEIYLEAKKR